MTFEEWEKQYVFVQYDVRGICQRAFEAGAASRDAEVAELRQQVTLLRDAILAVCCDPEGVVCIRGSDGDRKVLQDALDVTKQKEPK